MQDSTGKIFGKYRILESLGKGGMAEVYKAYDPRLERYVALKVILAEKDKSGDYIKRFKREARALAQLSHPNIVRILDYGEVAERPFLVMEYVSGGTLKNRFPQPGQYSEAVRLLLPVTRALDYVHRHHIVHRDVKPSNILMNELGEPMLSDFGIAKMLNAEETTDLTGASSLGTPEYMAPEQVTNKGVDARTDIYALGVILFEMLVGRKPYQSDNPLATAVMHVTEPVPRLSSHLPQVPQSLEDVVNRALAKEPSRRYQSAGEMGEALQAALGEGAATTAAMARGVRTVTPPRAAPVLPVDSLFTSVQATAPSATLWSRAADKKRPLILTLTGLLAALLLVVGGIIFIPRLLQAAQARSTATLPAKTAAAAATSATVSPTSGVYTTASPAIQSTEPMDTPAPTMTLQPTSPQPTSGPPPTAVISLPPTGEFTPLLVNTPLPETADSISAAAAARVRLAARWGMGVPTAGEFSPDGSLLAVKTEAGFILYDTADWSLRRFVSGCGGSSRDNTFNHPGGAFPGQNTAIAPDWGTYAVGECDGTISIYRLSDGERRQTLAGQDGYSRMLHFSAGGSRVLSWGVDGVLRAWDVQSGEQLLTYPVTGSGVVASPDGSLVAVVDGSSVQIIRTSDMTLQYKLTHHTSEVDGVVFSADAAWLATWSGGDHSLWLVKTADASLRLLFSTTVITNYVTTAQFSPDSLSLVFGTVSSVTTQYNITDQTHQVIPMGGNLANGPIVFAADSQHIASGRIALKTGTTAGSWIPLAALEEGLVGLAFSPNGRILTALTGSGVQIRDVNAKKVLTTLDLPGHNGAVIDLAFSLDGEKLLSGGDEYILWDRAAGTPLFRKTYAGKVTGLAFAPDGSTFATGRSWQDSDLSPVETWRVRDGGLALALQLRHLNISSLVYSLDGGMLAVGAGSSATIQFFDPATGSRLRSIAGVGSFVTDLAFSADGKLLAAAQYLQAGGESLSVLQVWSTAQGSFGTAVVSLDVKREYITSVAISPDGSLLAGGFTDGTVKVWSLPGGELVRTLSDEMISVQDVVFSGSGDLLATASGDGLVRLWQVSSGERLAALHGHTRGVTCLAFTRDDRLLASGSFDGMILLWEVLGR